MKRPWTWPAPGRNDARILRDALATGGRGAVAELSGGPLAWLLCEAASAAPGLLVAVVDTPRALDELETDLSALADGTPLRAWRLPPLREPAAAGATRTSGGSPDAARLDALSRAASAKRGILLAPLQALLEPAPLPDALRQGRRVLRLGDSADPDALATELAAQGYEFGAEVLSPGQGARHGGILDIWPPLDAAPLRIEFCGDEIDGIRRFDPDTQRSVETLRAADLPPVRLDDRQGRAADYFPPSTAFVWVAPDSILAHYAMAEELSGTAPDPATPLWKRFRAFRDDLASHCPGGGSLDVGGDPSNAAFIAREAAKPDGTLPGLEAQPFDGMPPLTGRAVPHDVLEAQRRAVADSLRARAAEGWTVELWFADDAAAARHREVHGEIPGAVVRRGALSAGFVLPRRRWLAAAEPDLYGVARRAPASRRAASPRRDATGDRLLDWADLRPGEYVVHVSHGIGKYLGLYEIRFEGQLQEALAIEYEGGARLYVPAYQAHLLTRYVGVGHAAPALHRLGSPRWQREKDAAQHAANDLAAQMLELQARRDALPGHAFPPDSHWQADFEDAFPYPPTPDQARAIADVKRDMESTRPMDRLVCGDAGFGKTEVALRAAFKAVLGGKQVAVLVPTTVLAQQHFETFLTRLAPFPVSVDCLNRYRSRAEQAEVLQRLATHRLDIVVGTHRLLSRDVRFADLGLVVVDEEQRFGVAAKEHLKRMRDSVDVLTLSATPIPRTLYLSLTGARDLSLIQTPPRERLPIETYVAADTDELLRSVILREFQRGGQVFFLHNRVQTIDAVRRRLRALVPEARIGVAHGQLPERQLAAVVGDFVRRRTNLLLCTTIIESGIDMPNVNTILVDRADRFGMADLYQIRGRVGRSRVQAYAYLLLPGHLHLFGAARERIAALRKHTALGAGYKLALRDLELRGAGNLLGAAQSGHIAAVGFDLYCQLLARTVARLQGRPMPPLVDVRLKLDFLAYTPDAPPDLPAATIPPSFVEDEGLRIQLFRQLAAVATPDALSALASDWRDRFGPLPLPVKRLFALAQIRLLAAALHVTHVAVEGDKLVLQLPGKDRWLMPGGRHPRLHLHDPDARLAEISKRLLKLLPSTLSFPPLPFPYPP